MNGWHNEQLVETIDGPSPKRGTLNAKFMPKEAFLEHAMLLAAATEASPPLHGQPRTKFKKAAHSSPSQVRRQFLQHTMGYESRETPSKPTSKLRPPKQVINKLRHDPAFDLEDFVIGYIDHKSGILEKPASKWAAYDLDDLVAYFRQVSQDRIVWDRAQKIDRLHAP